MKQRNKTIDICKGIGMLLVVIAHRPTPFNPIIYSFHMGLFFFLSGWCFSDKYLENKIEFIKKRTLQLLFPYYVCYFLAYILFDQNDLPIYRFYKAVAPMRILGGLWFIKSLWVAGIITLFSLYALKVLRISNWILPLSLLIVVHILQTILPNSSICIFLYIAFFYSFGYCLKQGHFPLFSQIPITANNIAIMGGVIMTFLLVGRGSSVRQLADATAETYIIYAIATFCGIWLTSKLSAEITRRNRLTDFFSIIGEHTMTIYLLHMIVFAVIDITVRRMSLSIPPLWLIIAEVAAAIAFPIAISSILAYIRSYTRKA